MATILQNCIFWISQCDIWWKPVYVSRNKWRCKDTFVRVALLKLISEHSHWRTCTSCAPNVKPKLKFTQFLYNFWCYEAFPHLRFSASWLCPVDLQPSWMAEMPSVWFRSCYSFKIFSTCEIFSTCASTGTEACKNALHPEDGAKYRPPFWPTLSLISAQQHILVNHLSRAWKAFEGQDKFVWTVVWLVDHSPFFTGIDPATFQWPARRFNHVKKFSGVIPEPKHSCLSFLSRHALRLRRNLMRGSDLGGGNMGHRGSVLFFASCWDGSWQVWVSVW